MFVAIWLGSMIGSGVASMLGMAGGILGAVVVGGVVYAIFALVKGEKMSLMSGLIFAVLVYVAQLLAGMVSGALGMGGGLVVLGIEAVLLSFLWGSFGASGKKSKSPIKL